MKNMMTLTSRPRPIANEINCFESFKIQVDMLAKYLEKLEGSELHKSCSLLETTFKSLIEKFAKKKKLNMSHDPNMQDISLPVMNPGKLTNGSRTSYFDAELSFTEKFLSSVTEDSFLHENLLIQTESSNLEKEKTNAQKVEETLSTANILQKSFLKQCTTNEAINHSSFEHQYADIELNYDTNTILNLKKEAMCSVKEMQQKNVSQDAQLTSSSLNFGINSYSILKSVSSLDKEHGRLNLLKDSQAPSVLDGTIKALNLVSKRSKETDDCRTLKRDFTEKNVFIDGVESLNCEQSVGSVNNIKEECPVSCRKCQKKFIDALLWIEHEKVCSVNLSCNLCDMSFKTKYNFNKHMTSHKRNTCPQCSSTFSRQKVLRAHMKSSHGINIGPDSSKTFPCCDCTRVFMKRVSLYHHMQISHALPDQKVCLKCGTFVNGDVAYKQHMAMHSQNALQCKICEETFQRRQQYNHHMESHEKHVCAYCESGTSFSSKKSLFKHYQTMHPELPQRVALNKKYPCDQCSRVFFRPSLLNDHKRTHSDETLECRLCNMKYMQRSSLKKHLRNVHSQNAAANNADKTKFPCKHCNFISVSIISLNKHMLNAHNVVNKHACMYCDYKAKNRHLLHRHIDSHLGKNKYMCHICGSLFCSSSTLKQHTMFIHSNERGYKCKHCDKSFKIKGSLSRHNKTHSSDRPYKCECGSCFKHPSLLNRHQANVHKKKLFPKKVRKLDSKEQEEFLARERTPNISTVTTSTNIDAEKPASDIFLATGTAATTVLMPEGTVGTVVSDNPPLFTVLDSQLIHLIPSSMQLQDGIHTVSLVNGELHTVSIASPTFQITHGAPFPENSTSDTFMIHQSTSDGTALELRELQGKNAAVSCNELNENGNSLSEEPLSNAECVPQKAIIISEAQELSFSPNNLQELNYRENVGDTRSTNYLTQENSINQQIGNNGSIF